MDYEKKYKEALERARKSYVNSIEQGWTCDKVIYEEIFPELKESKDEKIRKVLINGFQHYDKECKWGEFTTTEILSWLEKQGEQKPSDENDIEYTWKDSFIDKAWQWIFRVFVITAPLDFQQAIEKEFRKEMKGE